MMPEIQMLGNIVQELKDLGNKNKAKMRNSLDKSHRKLIMIVERKFGKERDYLNQLEEIKRMRIGPVVLTTGTSDGYIDSRVRNDLIRKRDRYLNFIETILYELKIDKNDKQKKKGKDFENMEDLVFRILNRFHRFIKQLNRRQGKSTLPIIEINNEYDIQDILHALLKLEFDDVRPEEYTPSYGGSNSRMDFLLKQEKIVIEVKKTSNTLKDKEIGKQLIEDSAKYKSHPDCKTLFCFIYDPDELISNPDGLEYDLSKEEEGFKVKVVINPKR